MPLPAAYDDGVVGRRLSAQSRQVLVVIDSQFGEPYLSRWLREYYD